MCKKKAFTIMELVCFTTLATIAYRMAKRNSHILNMFIFQTFYWGYLKYMVYINKSQTLSKPLMILLQEIYIKQIERIDLKYRNMALIDIKSGGYYLRDIVFSTC